MNTQTNMEKSPEHTISQSAEDVNQTTESDLTNNPKEKAKVTDVKEKKKKSRKKNSKRTRKTAKTKIIVRRLPPNLPEDVFMNAVKRWTSDDVVDYRFYVPGKLTQSKGKENIFSRAYFHMKSVEAVVAFHQGFDGHIFIDNKGTEHRAVVEFAPFQKLPKEAKNPDARQGTIDEDKDYLEFVESLKAEEEKKNEPKEVGDGSSQLERLENRLALVTAQTLAAEQASKPKTTPLIEHIRAQKAAQAAAKAKAKAQAKSAKLSKAAKLAKKAKGTKDTDTDTSAPKTPVEGSTSEGGKKPRRNRKKKAEGASNEGDKPNKSPKTPKPPKAPKSEGDAKPDKPKKSKKKDGPKAKASGGSENKPLQPVAILGRQQQPKSSDPSSSR
ncbi:Smg-4/UPF3 family-domain-containing protein [Dichotomocladium elegans]|nr:Smg-4/UPF3 family-domain-containing protein [Dichotomocladium elegans]